MKVHFDDLPALGRLSGIGDVKPRSLVLRHLLSRIDAICTQCDAGNIFLNRDALDLNGAKVVRNRRSGSGVKKVGTSKGIA